MGALAAILLSGLCQGAANDRKWVGRRMAAFSIKRYEGSPNCFINMEIGGEAAINAI
jgi:hypothetical protein